MLVGGRVSAEDAYAYSKFTRIALQTNDIDFRARPHSVEEAEFLASHVVATGPDGGAVTYADLERARTVVLVGFEPEDESPIVFLRLRKAFRKNKTAVYAVAPFATRGLEKLGGTLVQAAARHRGRGPRGAGRRRPRRRHPGLAAAAAALAGEGAVLLVGERLAGGARSAVRGRGPGGLPGAAWRGSRAVPASGARWRPVRAEPAARRSSGHRVRRPRRGRRGLGRGRPARAASGRDTAAIIAAAGAGQLGGLLVGGVDPADLVEHSEVAGRADRARSWSPSRCARARSPRSPTSCCPWPRTGRRPAPSSTGRGGSGPSRPRWRPTP